MQEKTTAAVENGNGSQAESLAEQVTKNPLEVVQTSVMQILEDFLAHLPLLGVGLVVMILTWLLAQLARRIVDWSMGKSRLRIGLKSLLRQLTQLTVWLVGLMIVAIVIFPGMTPARAIAVLGLGSVAIGFAFKDIFENFFAGVLILWRFPFDPGDYITCGEFAGQVEDITIRMTQIRQVDGQLVTLPNSKLFKDPVTIMTSRPQRRMSVVCGVSYDTDLDEAHAVILDAVEGCRTVNNNRDVEVFATEFGSSSINFEVRWWADATPIEEKRSVSEVVIAIKQGIDKAGIEIPFPYRTLTFKEPLRTESLQAEQVAQ